ncbi:hypothetical protein [Xanthomonas bromi]|nr:hypothetical protein [Xanthomonas bromi]
MGTVACERISALPGLGFIATLARAMPAALGFRLVDLDGLR